MYGELVPVGAGDPFSLMKTEVTVGRHKQCDVVLNYPNVSGKHCKLVLSDGYWYIVDLQSTNGVKVNGRKTLNSRIDPNVPLTVSTHGFKIEYNPVSNGAKGMMPPNTLQEEGEVMSESLLQRAGLAHKKSVQDGGRDADEPELDALTSPPKPSVKDFFSGLAFD
ncbi:MAG: FHA domain-containing protein [Planctomycetaceae bacterium]|jgi:pSer/pThr/pTyr-binding forkhead associated (FHA) protein|nr:FHA domain-containing protein [Planctomycetaceae bacterium]